MQTQVLTINHITIRPGDVPRIAQTGVKVRFVAELYHNGLPPAEIAAQYGLSLAQIYAALAYYYDHRAELDASGESDQAVLDSLGEGQSLASLRAKIEGHSPHT